MKEGIELAIKGPGPDKVPGSCKTPNRALSAGLTVLLPYLERLYNTCLFHGYQPKKTLQ